MGFASSGACFPTQQAALNDWCTNVEPGDSFSSCSSCNAATGSCVVTMTMDNGVGITPTVSVSTPACTVPEPATDAMAFTSAAIALWVAAWAGRALYQFFRVPHHE